MSYLRQSSLFHQLSPLSPVFVRMFLSVSTMIKKIKHTGTKIRVNDNRKITNVSLCSFPGRPNRCIRFFVHEYTFLCFLLFSFTIIHSFLSFYKITSRLHALYDGCLISKSTTIITPIIMPIIIRINRHGNRYYDK